MIMDNSDAHETVMCQLETKQPKTPVAKQERAYLIDMIVGHRRHSVEVIGLIERVCNAACAKKASN